MTMGQTQMKPMTGCASVSSWARENPERMAEIARLPIGEQNEALRQETVGTLLRLANVKPCANQSDPFVCPITYSPSEWSEELGAYFCRECPSER